MKNINEWIVLIGITNFIECYSSLEDQKCMENNKGDAHDMIFWRRNCTEIGIICEENQLTGVNVTHCKHELTGELKPIQTVIHRVLASEEYY